MSLNNHYFYNITRKVITQFCDIFNDTDIVRYDQDGNIIKFVRVPVKFAPKTKQWYWTELRENKDRRDSIFPMIAIDLTGMEYAQDRQVARNMKIVASSNGTSVDRFYNPIPYDFNFTVQIASEYIMDITQISEQILPFFSPEGYIRITVPELNITGLASDGQVGSDKLELRVTYDTFSPDLPVELEEAGYRILLWNITFKVQGYLFSPVMTNSLIQKVVQSYYYGESSWLRRGEDVDNMFYDVGNAQSQNVTYADVIPPPNQPFDDSYRQMIKYEHYPKWSDVVLFTSPSLYTCTQYPFTFEILSSAPISEIWYTVTEITDEYILDNNLDYIIEDSKYLILDSFGNTLPTYLYMEPITVGKRTKSYNISYIGVGVDGYVTNVYTEYLHTPNLPVI